MPPGAALLWATPRVTDCAVTGDQELRNYSQPTLSHHSTAVGSVAAAVAIAAATAPPPPPLINIQRGEGLPRLIGTPAPPPSLVMPPRLLKHLVPPFWGGWYFSAGCAVAEGALVMVEELLLLLLQSGWVLDLGWVGASDPTYHRRLLLSTMTALTALHSPILHGVVVFFLVAGRGIAHPIPLQHPRAQAPQGTRQRRRRGTTATQGESVGWANGLRKQVTI